jgi:dynein assembly factor 5, axonemal
VALTAFPDFTERKLIDDLKIMSELSSEIPGPCNDGVGQGLMLLQKFQRDINRMSDSDRMTRKRGLQKLLDELPWKSGKQRGELEKMIAKNILLPLIEGLSDPVEKCRELSISLLASSLTVMRAGLLTSEVMLEMIRSLCDRLNDVPFKEASEELRLQILELLKGIMKHAAFTSAFNHNPVEVADLLLSTMVKALLDSFPAAKRAAAEIVCTISVFCPVSVRMCFKPLLKSLVGNATHQHSKTRSVTLQVMLENR